MMYEGIDSECKAPSSSSTVACVSIRSGNCSFGYIYSGYIEKEGKKEERERGGDVIIYEGELPLSYLIESLAFLYSIINRIYI
jgi:hypothetical protein